MKRTLLCVAIASLIGATGCSTTKDIAKEPPKEPVVLAQVQPVVAKSTSLEKKPDVTKAEASFVESNGALTLEFDDEGNWLKIKTSGTSPLEFNHANAKEQAFTVAQMRAKRNLIEFLNNDVKSQKSVTNVSEVFLKDIVKDQNATKTKPKKESTEDSDVLESNNETSQDSMENRKRANKVAMTVREQINDNAAGILKGVYVSNRSVDRESNQVSVELTVTRKTINVASQLRGLMGSN